MMSHLKYHICHGIDVFVIPFIFTPTIRCLVFGCQSLNRQWLFVQWSTGQCLSEQMYRWRTNSLLYRLLNFYLMPWNHCHLNLDLLLEEITQSILACVKLLRFVGIWVAERLLLSRILVLLILTSDRGFFNLLRATMTGTEDLVTR